jgi:hypothetical protein
MARRPWPPPHLLTPRGPPGRYSHGPTPARIRPQGREMMLPSPGHLKHLNHLHLNKQRQEAGGAAAIPTGLVPWFLRMELSPVVCVLEYPSPHPHPRSSLCRHASTRCARWIGYGDFSSVPMTIASLTGLVDVYSVDSGRSSATASGRAAAFVSKLATAASMSRHRSGGAYGPAMCRRWSDV